MNDKTHFIARYETDGVSRAAFFAKDRYTQSEAEKELNDKGIKNFMFFFEAYEPIAFGENGFLFRGEIGFDITTEKLLPFLQAGNEIILDSFGGSLWEGWKIYDAIKTLGTNPSIGVLGSCASAATLPLLATSNRWATENSRGLIHNPWAMEVGDDDILFEGAKSLKEEKNRIAKLYANISGRPVDEILALMKEERFMTAEEMLEYNFIIEIKNKQILKNEKMNKEEIKAALEAQEKSLLSKIKAWIVPKSPKNAIFQDVNGVDLDFGEDIETIDQIVVGSTATVEGDPAEGDYVLSNGNTYTFEGGAVTEIKESEEDDLEAENAALKQELEDLKAQKTAKDLEVENLISEKEKIKAKALEDLNSVKADFDTFKNKFSNGAPTLKVPDEEESAGSGFKFKKK